MFPVHLNDGENELPKDDIFYVIGENGVHLRKKVGLIDSLAPVDRISILKPIETYAKMDIKKIPIPVFANILGFFRKVYEEYRSECVVILHYNEKNGNYKVECPPQKVGPASLAYTGAQNYKGYIRVGTIHSHAGMGAFHSGTDVHDEEHFDGLHITLGNMRDDDFSISSSVVSNGLRIVVDSADYIDGISHKEEKKWVNINGVMTEVAYTSNTSNTRYVFSHEHLGPNFPKAWFKRVEHDKPIYQTYTYGGTYGKHPAANRGHFLPGFNTGGYSRRGGSRVFTPNSAVPRGLEPGIRRDRGYSFRSEDYNLDPCESCVFGKCEGASRGAGRAAAEGMDFDEVVKYVFENFDDEEIYEMGIMMLNGEIEADEEEDGPSDLTTLLTADVGAETSGMDIGMDEIPPSMIMDGGE